MQKTVDNWFAKEWKEAKALSESDLSPTEILTLQLKVLFSVIWHELISETKKQDKHALDKNQLSFFGPPFQIVSSSEGNRKPGLCNVS